MVYQSINISETTILGVFEVLTHIKVRCSSTRRCSGAHGCKVFGARACKEGSHAHSARVCSHKDLSVHAIKCSGMGLKALERLVDWHSAQGTWALNN